MLQDSGARGVPTGSLLHGSSQLEFRPVARVPSLLLYKVSRLKTSWRAIAYGQKSRSQTELLGRVL
jgi:hypothetical protein